MEQELIFGLDLVRLALLKKKIYLGRLRATFEAGFFKLSRTKENIVASAKVIYPKYSIHGPFCYITFYQLIFF